MVLEFFQGIFCCYSTTSAVETEAQYDETTHLIPHIIEPPVDPNDQAYINYQKFQARLSEIVRAKEGKMVNVASSIPFNLHNRVIPVEASVSRSLSEPEDDEAYHPSQTYYDVYTNRTSARKRKRHPYIGPDHHYASASATAEAGFLTDRRSPSPMSAQPRPRPILNIRLVGCSEITTRGRTIERGPNLSGLPPSHKDGDTSSEQPDADEPQKLTAADVQFYNIGPLTINWD